MLGDALVVTGEDSLLDVTPIGDMTGNELVEGWSPGRLAPAPPPQAGTLHRVAIDTLKQRVAEVGEPAGARIAATDTHACATPHLILLIPTSRQSQLWLNPRPAASLTQSTCAGSVGSGRCRKRRLGHHERRSAGKAGRSAGGKRYPGIAPVSWA